MVVKVSVWHVKRLVFPKVKATHDAIHIDLQRKGPQMHHTDTVRELSSSNLEKKKVKIQPCRECPRAKVHDISV